jgi:virulence factor Mce-like protein
MTKRIHKPTLIVTIALWLGAAIAFVIFNNAFGGPEIGPSNPYRVSAFAADSQNLLTKGLVLERGVRVGVVDNVSLSGNRARFTIAVDRRYAPIYRDATVSIGHRTLFGEAYVNLFPGTPARGALPDNATLPARAVVPVVNVDQALEVLDAQARHHLISLARTATEVNQDPMAAPLLNGTLGGFAATLAQLRRMSDLLGDQQSNIAQFVSNGRVVLDVLASREQAIATLIHGARTSLEGLTADDAALRGGLAQSPPLLASTRTTLAAALPLLHDARPVVVDVTHAAPALTAAFTNLSPVARSSDAVLAGLPGFRAAAVPVLHLLLGASNALGPAVAALQPSLQDLIPVIRYLAPYKREIVGFSMNTGAGAHTWNGDGTIGNHPTPEFDYKTGVHKFGTLYGLSWPRFQVVVQSATALDKPDPGVSINPYAPPNSPAAAYKPGDYHRLQPYPLPYRARPRR